MADKHDRPGGGLVFRAGPDGVEIAESGEQPEPTPDERARLRGQALREMTFSTHLISLNAMALMHLGEMEGVADDERDLEAAQHVIDTLVVLREKTSGNLTTEESSLLDALLYDLRMKYLRHAGKR